MGQIQSSMNRITTLVSGVVAGGIKGYQKAQKANKTKPNEPKAETNWNMGNIVNIRPIKRAAHYAAIGQESAQGMIQEKYGSATFSVADRIKQAQEASSLSVIKQKEESE